MAKTDLPVIFRQGLEATKVSYTNLGASGLRVSVPILEGLSFGHKNWRPWVEDNEEAVGKLLKGAFDRGLNTWDTANIYSNGVSEKLIGRAIKEHDIPRHKLVILTKCFFPVGESVDVNPMRYPDKIAAHKDYVNQYGLSRAAIFNAVNASLQRLQTDYIDVLQIQRYDKTVRPEETMKALHDLIEAGKVRYIGASSMWTYQFTKLQSVAEKNGWTQFISMSNHYSLLYREEEREMNKFCHETGVGLVPWNILYSDALIQSASAHGQTATYAYGQSIALTEADKEIVRRVEEVANKRGWKMIHVALAWSIHQETIPVIGFRDLSKLDEILEVKGKILSDEEIKFLEEPYVPKAIQGHT